MMFQARKSKTESTHSQPVKLWAQFSFPGLKEMGIFHLIESKL